MYGDAVSLSREQVEKVFIICLLLDDPDKWAILYQKYAWMKLYEDFLLQTYECSELTRFEEFQTNIGPDILEKMRVECGVTLLEQEATKNRFDNRFYARNAPLPAHLADHVIPAFPTPGNARSQPKDSGVRRLLDRWFHMETTLRLQSCWRRQGTNGGNPRKRLAGRRFQAAHLVRGRYTRVLSSARLPRRAPVRRSAECALLKTPTWLHPSLNSGRSSSSAHSWASSSGKVGPTRLLPLLLDTA